MPGVCKYVFNRYRNNGANGAEKVKDVTDQDKCEDFCREDDDCLAYEFDFYENCCWIFTDEIDAEDLEFRSRVNHYIKQEVCEGEG